MTPIQTVTTWLVVIFALYLMLDLMKPRAQCPFCGKTKEHARDCWTQRDKGKDT